MADDVVQLDPDGTGKKVDNESLTVGANTVYRQRTQIAGVAAAEIARVQATAPAGTEQGLVVRPIPSGTQPVSAAALPLPAGAATEATVAGIKTGTDKIPASPSTDRTTAAGPFATRLSDGAAFYKATTPADTQPISAASLPLPAGAATAALQTQPGVDIGDVTVNNAAGASAVNIQDGGNSITVDAASLPLPTGASTLAEQQTQTTHLATIAGDTTDIETAVELIDDTVATLGTATYTEATTKGIVIGAVRRDADTTLVDTTNEIAPLQVDANGRLKVEAFSGETLPISGSVSVTGALPAGDNNVGNVDIVTMPNVTLAAGTNTNEVVGDVAENSAIAGNPVAIGLRASTAVPAAMSADGNAVYMWGNRSGAPIVTAAPHVGLNSDPWNLVHEAAQYTGTQTSTVLVAGGASEKIVVTKVQIQVGGTTAGTLQLYFGTGAFVRGTNRAIFDGEFAPSATHKPGVVMDGPFIAGTNGDDLLVTDSAAINPLTINVWYYVVT